MNLPSPGKRFVIGVPYAWLIVFFFLPFLILAYISFVDMGNDLSPFKPLWDPVTGVLSLKYENYLSIFRMEEGAPLFQTLYVEAYLRSIWYALCTAVLCLILGYPFAYFIARSPASVRPALLLMVMLPFWTSFLLRVYAWKGLLADQGVINRFMMGLGITSEPIPMLYTDVSMLVGMTYVYLPFMVLPLYANLVKMDFRLLEAARDLGATPWQAFWRISLPLLMPGILSGAMMAFIISMDDFVITYFVAGAGSTTLPIYIFSSIRMGISPKINAISSIMLVISILFVALSYYLGQRKR